MTSINQLIHLIILWTSSTTLICSIVFSAIYLIFYRAQNNEEWPEAVLKTLATVLLPLIFFLAIFFIPI